MGYESWTVGDAYEGYVGRWSRAVAPAFLRWLDLPGGLAWLDVGCGTGALTAAVLAHHPARVVGVDPSEGFLSVARDHSPDPRTSFHLGDAMVLPASDGEFDAVASGLVLNFLAEPTQAVAEFRRVVRPGGVVAAYVWDYAEGMQMLRYFWDAATSLDPAAAALDEGIRFPLCHPQPLRRLWLRTGLRDVSTSSLDVVTRFSGFDDYWRPFRGGQGPAPGYVSSLPDRQRDQLRELLRAHLPTTTDGSIELRARAWAVRGTVY